MMQCLIRRTPPSVRTLPPTLRNPYNLSINLCRQNIISSHSSRLAINLLKVPLMPSSSLVVVGSSPKTSRQCLRVSPGTSNDRNPPLRVDSTGTPSRYRKYRKMDGCSGVRPSTTKVSSADPRLKAAVGRCGSMLALLVAHRIMATR